MYHSAATQVLDELPKTITTVEESSLKFEILNFSTASHLSVSKKIELLSIDAVWWATVQRCHQDCYDFCIFTVNLEAKPGSSYLSKNFRFNIEAKIGKIQCVGLNTLQASTLGNWKFESAPPTKGTTTSRPGRLTSILGPPYLADYYQSQTVQRFLSFCNQREAGKSAGMEFADVVSKVPLVVDFKLFVVHTNDGSEIEKFYDPTAMKNEIIANNSKMLDDPTFSDFTFIVQGKDFKVHKFVLGPASEVFAKLFTTKMAESEKNECKVPHLDPTAFEHMLRFIYSGKLPKIFNAEVAQAVYEVAHYYNIKTLKKVCEPEVLGGLNVDNALDLYERAQLYDLQELKKEAWVIIKRDLLKIFFPLEKEPLPFVKVQEMLQQKLNEKEYWGSIKRVKLSTADPKA